MKASGGTSPYTWSLPSGSSLPPGLTLDKTGAISGTPSTAGTYSFSVQANDSAGHTATKSFKLLVASSTLATAPTATLPALPLYTVNTTFPDTTGYVVKTVGPAAGDNYTNLQTALNSIHTDGGDTSGEILELDSGATFTGNFTLPAYTMAAGKWVIVTTNTAASNLPSPGVRINPSYSPVLAKIFSANYTTAVSTTDNSNHYWFMGVEMGATLASSTFSYGIFLIGGADTSLSTVPNNIIIDRCYIHGTPTGNVTRGVAVNGISIAVVNSYIEHIQFVLTDTQAVGAWNAPGPILIENNFLEAGAENVMFGGANSHIPNLINSDITIRRNYFFKPLTWNPWNPSYAGITFTVKNLLEFKNAQRVLVEANVFENSWGHGPFLVFSPRNSGAEPWADDADITVRYNWAHHVSGGFIISGGDSVAGGGAGFSLPSQRIYIHDNLFTDVNGVYNNDATAGTFFKLATGQYLQPHDLFVDHNTCIMNYAALSASAAGYTALNSAISNNIVPRNSNGFFGLNTTSEMQAIEVYFQNGFFAGNVIMAPSGASASAYPGGNYVATSWASVFADPTNCPASPGSITSVSALFACALSSSSPYLGKGTGGTNPGADIAGLAAALAGVAP
jgi:hypothetical protein